MAIKLKEVVPWGRNADEYIRMFALTGSDLSRRILGCGDGPASFNTEMFERGHAVTSCDPLYDFSVPEIEARIAETYDTILDGLRKHPDKFVWNVFRDPEDLGASRMASMRRFLEDFPEGKSAGRYITASLPALPFSDNAFDLVLCSHFLFLYSAQLSYDFHRATVFELCRVAAEVRIFPVFDLDVKQSTHVEPLMSEVAAAGHAVELVQVPYEHQKGANKMLLIRVKKS
jgi:hypothetical protein